MSVTETLMEESCVYVLVLQFEAYIVSENGRVYLGLM